MDEKLHGCVASRTWDEFHQFEGFLFTKFEEGAISRAQMDEILLVHAKLIVAAGDDDDRQGNAFIEPLLRHSLHLMRKKLIESCSELERELSKHMSELGR